MSKRIEYIIDDIKEQYLEKDNNIGSSDISRDAAIMQCI